MSITEVSNIVVFVPLLILFTSRRWYYQKKFIASIGILTTVIILSVILGSVLGSRYTKKQTGMFFLYILKNETHSRLIEVEGRFLSASPPTRTPL